jgi:glycerophosphoryl diester phosphodiesterase
MINRYRWVARRLRTALKPAIVFELWSTVIFVVSFGPASGWLLNRLVAASGQYAVADHDLAGFFLSLPGVLFVVLNVTFVLAFWFAEQVGLLIIMGEAGRGQKVAVSVVLWERLTQLPALLRLGLVQALVYLGAAVPFLGGIGIVKRVLLSEWDFYYYLNVQPAEWWWAVAIVGLLVAVYAVLAAWLYVRWMLAIPTLVFEGVTPVAALRISWERTRGRFWRLALPLGVWWLAIIVSSSVVVWVIQLVASRVLAGVGFRLTLLVPAVLGALALMALVELTWFIAAKIVHVCLVGLASQEARGGEPPVRQGPVGTSRISPRTLRLVAWIFVVVMALTGIGSAIAFVERLDFDREIAITAHRGSKLRAPENTLTALRKAIEDGADFCELDVQTTADGIVVLLHDADLMRVSSERARLRDLDHADLADIDVGSWFDPAFADERIGTLQEAIDIARDRIKLNIELKFNWADPALTPAVAELIRSNDFVDQCVVSSLEFSSLAEMREAVPGVPTGFIVFQAIGDVARMEADFVSINAAQATAGFVRDVHGRGREVHVWTVNDLHNALAMIEVGVDNIITDRPRELRQLLTDWGDLTQSEKIALMLRNLIVEWDRPEPSEL